MGDASLGEALKPGAICAQAGVYQVTHRAHRATHQVVVRKGDPFPRCNGCGDAVRFRLIKTNLIKTKMTAEDQVPPDPERKRSAGQGS